MKINDVEYKILKQLELNKNITQRELAKTLDISLGKTNYIINAFIDKGWVKLNNFRKSNNKIGYAYLLTPIGIVEKSALTWKFLIHKQQEFDDLKKEITSSFPGLVKQTIINDYIFICFLLGNDFIKNSPSLILRYDGLSHLTDVYKQCQEKHNNKFYLINPKTKSLLHWKNFKEFIQCLSDGENDRMNEIFSIRLKQHRKYKRIYDDIQKNKDTVISSNSKNKLGFPSEDIMRHKPVIFMDDESHKNN